MALTPLTGNTLYDMVTALNGGQSMDETLFYQIAIIVQEKIETARNWMILRKQDRTKSISPSDNFLTAKALPSDFNKWQSERPIVLIEPGNVNNFQPWYKEVPLAWQYDYQYESYKYCVDYAANNLYILDNVDRTYTIVMNYLYKPDIITTNTSWVFPAQYHPLLAYAIVAQSKGGIDFDEQNARMAGDNKETVEMIYQSMAMWDDQLQEMSIEGVDRSMMMDKPWIGGHVDMND